MDKLALDYSCMADVPRYLQFDIINVLSRTFYDYGTVRHQNLFQIAFTTTRDEDMSCIREPFEQGIKDLKYFLSLKSVIQEVHSLIYAIKTDIHVLRQLQYVCQCAKKLFTCRFSNRVALTVAKLKEKLNNLGSIGDLGDQLEYEGS